MKAHVRQAVSTRLAASVCVLGSCLGWPFSASADSPSYRIVQVGPADLNTWPYAVNNHGWVVGNGFDEERGINSAFYWHDGDFALIPELAGYWSSGADDINDDGTIVGTATVGPDDNRVFSWRDGQLTWLPVGPGGDAYVRAINSNGVIVGGATDAEHITQPVAWVNGEIHWLPVPLPGYAIATAIDDRGTIFCDGTAYSDVDVFGYVYAVRDGQPRIIIPYRAGVITADVHDVSNSGVMVGDMFVTKPYPWGTWGYALNRGQPRLLPSLGPGTYASAVNESGLIVGTSDSQLHFGRGVLFQGDQVFDLNTLIPPDSGWYIRDAIDINEIGWILAATLRADAQTIRRQACLLIPAN